MKPFLLLQFSQPGGNGPGWRALFAICSTSGATQLRTLKKNVGIVSRYQLVVDFIFFYSFCERCIVSEARMCSIKAGRQRGTAFGLSWSITLFASSLLFDLHGSLYCSSGGTGAVGFVRPSVCLSVYSRNRMFGHYCCFLSAKNQTLTLLLSLHCTRLSARGQSCPWLQPCAQSGFTKECKANDECNGWLI